jgi:hypothetical protein
MADGDAAVAHLEAGKELPHLSAGFPINTDLTPIFWTPLN